MDKRTKVGILILVAGISTFLLGTFATGCVKVRIPEELRDPGEPERIPLVDAELKYETKAKALGEFAVNIRGGQRQRQFFEDLNSAFWAEINVLGQEIPGWGLLTLLGGGLFGGGVLIRRPGDKTQADVDAAWDEATAEALALLKEGANKLKESVNE